MGCNCSVYIVYCTPVVYCTIADVTHIFVTSRIYPALGRFATPISLRKHANELYADRFDAPRNEKKTINLMLFNEIDNFIEVYNNSVIELVQCFGSSFFGRIDHLASAVIKFRPKNVIPKHCIRSIAYNYILQQVA